MSCTGVQGLNCFYMYVCFFVFFFFFQAEDGIRDDLVTGVQTCALPISTTQDYYYCCVVHTAGSNNSMVLC